MASFIEELYFLQNNPPYKIPETSPEHDLTAEIGPDEGSTFEGEDVSVFNDIKDTWPEQSQLPNSVAHIETKKPKNLNKQFRRSKSLKASTERFRESVKNVSINAIHIYTEDFEGQEKDEADFIDADFVVNEKGERFDGYAEAPSFEEFVNDYSKYYETITVTTPEPAFTIQDFIYWFLYGQKDLGILDDIGRELNTEFYKLIWGETFVPYSLDTAARNIIAGKEVGNWVISQSPIDDFASMLNASMHEALYGTTFVPDGKVDPDGEVTGTWRLNPSPNAIAANAVRVAIVDFLFGVDEDLQEQMLVDMEDGTWEFVNDDEQMIFGLIPDAMDIVGVQTNLADYTDVQQTNPEDNLDSLFL